jgi:hypothetical protein
MENENVDGFLTVELIFSGDLVWQAF